MITILSIGKGCYANDYKNDINFVVSFVIGLMSVTVIINFI